MSNQQTTTEGSIWNRNLILATLCSLCAGVAGQLLNPTLPLYLLGIGIDAKFAGIMISAYSVGGIFFKPISGALVDTIGRRKVVMMGSSIIIFAYSGYLATDTIMAMIAIRVIQGIGFSMTTTGTGTIAADSVPRHRITEGIGYYALAGAVSMTIGPATGLWLYQLFPMEILFWIGIILASATLFAAYNISYEEQLKPKEQGFKGLHMFEKNALVPAAIIFMCAFSQVSLTAFLALYGLDMGIPSVGSFFLINSIGTISARLFAGRLTKILGEHKLLIGAIIITGLCQLAVGMSSSLFSLQVIGFVYGFGYGVLYPVTSAMAMKVCAPEHRGAANATYTSAFNISSVIGGLVWGPIGVTLGYSNMYLIAGIIVLSSIGMTFTYKKKFGFDV